MKTIKLFFIGLLFTVFISCDNFSKSSKNYEIYWEGDKLCIVMPHPTLGLVQPNQIGWRGVDTNKLVEDILKQLKKGSNGTKAVIYVRFENEITDNYGETHMEYNDCYLTKIPISEAKKYKGGKYLDNDYTIINHIKRAAFGNIDIVGELVVPYEDSMKYYD